MPDRASVYLDTSVINALFATDTPEWMERTKDFFETAIRTNAYDAFVSRIVLQEINNTGNEGKRQNLLDVIDEYLLQFADMTRLEEIDALADMYIEQKIIPPSKRADALHIAITTLNEIDYLVSWNFKHMVNVNREAKIIDVNHQNNYLHAFRIITPLQLIEL